MFSLDRHSPIPRSSDNWVKRFETVLCPAVIFKERKYVSCAFLPRDAIRAIAVHTVVVSLSVRLSVMSREFYHNG